MAFLDCIALTEVSLPKAITVGYSAFISCINLTKVSLPEAITIGELAFNSCRVLTEISLPKATTLGDNVFDYCPSLTKASLPKATTISKYAFNDCPALTEVLLSEATTVDELAFHHCTALTNVFIPKATTIVDNAFNQCTALSGLTLGDPPTLGGPGIFYNVSNALLLAVPDSTAYTASVLADYPPGTEAFNTSITMESRILLPGESETLIPNRIPTLQGGSYRWEKDGATIAGATGTTLEATSTGIYTLWYTRGNLSVPLLFVRLAATPYELHGTHNRYQQCDYTLQLSFTPSASDRTIYVWSEGSGAAYVFDAATGKYFKDIQTYKLPANTTTLAIPYKIDEDVEDASRVTFASKTSIIGIIQYTDTYTLYAVPDIKLVKYIPPTTQFKGVLDISVTQGSYYIQHSMDEGDSWQFARDTITGAMLPFSQSQIANFVPGSTILFRQPDGCRYEKLTIGSANNENINRLVTMPAVTDAVSTVKAGQHHIISGNHFVFTITPTGNNIGKSLHVSTSRTLVPDSEGVQIVSNEDGSYTVTILSIRETVTIAIDFATGIDAIDSNAVWSHANRLYIHSEEAGEATVYTLTGATVSKISVNAGETVVLPLSNGVYLISLNGKTYKIVAG